MTPPAPNTKWALTAEWTSYDEAVMRHLEDKAKHNMAGLVLWFRTATYTEPPFDARAAGYHVELNPNRTV